MGTIKKTVRKNVKIKRNKAQCAACGTVLESRTVEDTVYCRCGGINISGGKEKTLRGGVLNYVIDKTEYY